MRKFSLLQAQNAEGKIITSKNALWLKNDQVLVQQWLQQISKSETFSLQRLQIFTCFRISE